MSVDAQAAQPRLLRGAAFVAFFLSGASSLVFQTLWSRQLSHVFGSSSLAVSSVVSVFMAGLGLGAFWFGRRADRVRDPLLLYAAAEFAVGCVALLVPWLVRSDGWLSAVNAGLRAYFGAGSFAFVLARFACIVPILIVPTTLMGSTLPLLSRHFVAQHSSPQRASREVGRLYAVNTFGAVVGVFTCTFVLLPNVGVAVANAAAAGSNFALAALIVVLRRLTPLQPPAAAGATPAQPGQGETEPAYPEPQRRAAALAFAFSGFASLLYEVVWSRALVNTIGGSLYSFALILTTFLVGIAGGSALGSALTDRRRSSTTIAVAVSAGLCLLAAGPTLLRSPGTYAALVLGGWLALFVIARIGRLAATRSALFAEDAPVEVAPSVWTDARSAFAALGVPLALALIALVFHAQRLSYIGLTVIGSLVLLLGLLIALSRAGFGLLIALQLYVAAATLASDLFADSLSLTFAGMVAPLYHELPHHVGTVQGMMFLTAALCVLPSALGMGAVFPATLRVWTRGGANIGRDVGLVYTGNTLGSIAGAWLPGFVLMPAIGMQASLHVGMALNLLIALGLCVVGLSTSAADGGESRPRLRALRGVAVLVPWAIAALAFLSLRPGQGGLSWNISRMTLGAFRISLARDVLDEESWGAPDLVYYRDGLSTTVTVERWGRHYSLKNNGKVDASNGDDMPTQIMVAALPLLFHPQGASGRDLAIVGFGSGVTVGAALQFPVRSATVIELEASTIEASHFFADVNHLDYVHARFPYVREPRLTVVADDGRNYLAAAQRRYDVIVSEPSNPWLTGVSDLFTLDHFEIAKRKLAPGGIYCQWVQLYELSPENVKTIYRTFAQAWKHVLVFSAEDLSSDTVLIGSDQPLPLDLERVSRAFALPRVAAELERAYIHTPEDVLARVLISSRAELLQFTGGAPLNTDDNARIELAAPRDLIGFERYKGYLETMYAADWPYGRVLPGLIGFGQGARAAEHYARLAFALMAHGRKREVPDLLALAAAERAREPGAAGMGGDELHVVAEIHRLLGSAQGEPALGLPEQLAPEDAPADLRALVDETAQQARELLAQDKAAAALAKLERVPSHARRKLGSEWGLFDAYVKYKAGDMEASVDQLEELLRSDEGLPSRYPAAYYFLARSHDGLMHFDKGVRNMRVYVLASMAARVSNPP
ncbi:MAG TPA: fused MFS/spermidine synthase [Polyangiales bacterium]|nr:fused MFS/spermidine synthase [Polyangiales bacterium]